MEENEISKVDNVFRVIPAVNELYKIYEARKRHMLSGQFVEEDEEKIYVVINNYQWIEPIVRIMENKSIAEFEQEFNENTTESALDSMLAIMNDANNNTKRPKTEKQFRILLDSGYLCKIHFFMTCNEFSCIKNIMSSDLAPFTNRMMLKSHTPSSCTFIDSDINMKYMKENTVLFSDGINAPYLMKPYQIMNEK